MCTHLHACVHKHMYNTHTYLYMLSHEHNTCTYVKRLEKNKDTASESVFLQVFSKKQRKSPTLLSAWTLGGCFPTLSPHIIGDLMTRPAMRPALNSSQIPGTEDGAVHKSLPVALGPTALSCPLGLLLSLLKGHSGERVSWPDTNVGNSPQWLDTWRALFGAPTHQKEGRDP